MKLFDTLLGKTKPVKPNLDALFSLPSAAITLQTAAGLVPNGKAGVCFKPPAGQPFEEVQHEVEQLLAMDDSAAGATRASSSGAGGSAPGGSVVVHHEADSYGYRWIVLAGTDIDDLVTRVHMVHSSLAEAGWGPQLLCSVVGFGPGGDPGVESAVSRPVYLVYLAKRGTFYPFVPTGKEQRDPELELRLKSFIAGDLPVEPDLERWFPLWDMPIARA